MADEVIDLFAEAQEPDGYLNSYFSHLEPESKWQNLRDRHELYCAGHLMEAAVAYFEGTGKRKFLDVMCRYADCICDKFGKEEGKLKGYPGHEEIELALVKLYRVTGKKRYLDMAEFFVNERGTKPNFYEIRAAERGEDVQKTTSSRLQYWQAHLPVKEQEAAEGHAVRACYLYAGMADVAAETGDAELIEACRNLWRNITGKRMYVTGGIGSAHHGEAFTFDYDLPNEEAYAETCAAISLVFFAHRMLQLEKNSEYADIMEKVLYNGFLSGIDFDGRHFYYENPLAVYPEKTKFMNWNSGSGKIGRQEWFACACCPPNIARLLASLEGYFYSTSENDREIWAHLFASGTAIIQLGSDKITLTQETNYPWNGLIRFDLELENPVEFTLKIRIPAWCGKAEIRVNGEAIDFETENGYTGLNREWQNGDCVELELAMPVERIEAHPNLRQDAGMVAIQRGPVVYCLEEADNGRNLHSLAFPENPEFKLETGTGIFENIPLIKGRAIRKKESGWEGVLYRNLKDNDNIDCEITAVPYYMWCNRQPGEMQVWTRQL
jgi:DUF1680 family protein